MRLNSFTMIREREREIRERGEKQEEKSVQKKNRCSFGKNNKTKTSACFAFGNKTRHQLRHLLNNNSTKLPLPHTHTPPS